MAGARVLVIDDSATILRVVQLVLGKAGYEVATAPDGEAGIAAAEQARPDLILLDFVMPRMNGYQVCRKLAEIPALRDVPVVLLSAKGDQVGERFVRATGIVDYLTKPFPPEALLAVVEHSIARQRERQKAQPEAGAEALSEAAEIAAVSPRSPPSPQERRRAQEAELRAVLLAGLTTEGAAGEELVRQLEPLLDEALVHRLLEAILPPLDLDAIEPVLEGSLAAVPLPEVLLLLGQQTQTGVLLVVREGARVLLCFRDGKVDFAGSSGLGEDYFLDRYLHVLGVITREEFELLRATRSGGEALGPMWGAGDDDRPMRLLGEQLAKLRLVAAAEMREALRRQTCDRIHEVLGWREGRFAFTATGDIGPLADRARLGLGVEVILLEGMRRVDEWRLIERTIGDFETVFVPSEAAPALLAQLRLTREEQLVFDLIDGRNSVRDIQRQSLLGLFEVSQLLFRLQAIRLIRRRVPPVAV